MASTNTMRILSVTFIPDLIGIINDYLMPSKDDVKNSKLGVHETLAKISNKFGQDNERKVRVDDFHRRGWAQYAENNANNYFNKITKIVRYNLSPNACIMLDRQINETLHNTLSETFYKKIYKTIREPISGFEVFCHQERPGFKYVDWCGDKMRNKLLKKWNTLDEYDRNTYKAYKYCRYKRTYE
jgi:hypothetical protein